MVEWFLKDEMCDKCKKIKLLKDISKMEGKIKMTEGACYFYGKAICKECAENE